MLEIFMLVFSFMLVVFGVTKLFNSEKNRKLQYVKFTQ